MTSSAPARPSPPALAWPNTATPPAEDRKSTRLNSSHLVISYAVFCLKKKNTIDAHSEQDLAGVSVLDFDLLHRATETICDDLRARSFVSLCVAVRSCYNRTFRGLMHS